MMPYSLQQVGCERSAASTILSQRLVLNVQKPVQNAALWASEIRILPHKLRKRRSLPFLHHFRSQATKRTRRRTP